jgi:hypothetical protein
MAILYIIKINNPAASSDNISNWPPSIETSEWLQRYRTKFISNTGNNNSDRVAYFTDVTDFETWVNANRLTDATMLAELAEWKSTYNITVTEFFQQVPDYTPSIPGIFG